MGLFGRKGSNKMDSDALGTAARSLPEVDVSPEGFWDRSSGANEYDYLVAAQKVLRWVDRPLEIEELVRLIILGAPEKERDDYLLASERGRRNHEFNVRVALQGPTPLAIRDDPRYPVVQDAADLLSSREPGRGLPLPGGPATHVAAGDGGYAAMSNGSIVGWTRWSTPTPWHYNVGAVRALATVGEFGYALTEAGTLLRLPSQEPQERELQGTVITFGPPIEELTDVAAMTLLRANGGGLVTLHNDGSIVAPTWFSPYSDRPDRLRDVVGIAAGPYVVLALTDSGRVVAWGDGPSPQAAVPAGLTNVTAIDAGWGHCLALRADGTVVAWGDGEQARVPAGLDEVVAISAGHSHSVALRRNGTVVEWGGLDYLRRQHVLERQRALNGLVRAISAGSRSTLALLNDGRIVGWGDMY